MDHADELVALVDAEGDFTVGVAAFPEGHPEAHSLDDDDLKVLLAKQQAGADFAITQFFSASDHFDLVERARSMDCDMPIIPGIMPVTNLSQIERFAQFIRRGLPHDLGSGSELWGGFSGSRRTRRRGGGGDVSGTARWRCPGLHFYTLNRSDSTVRVTRNSV